MPGNLFRYCHGTGQVHAPVVGDTIEWEIRLEKGFDTLDSKHHPMGSMAGQRGDYVQIAQTAI